MTSMGSHFRFEYFEEFERRYGAALEALFSATPFSDLDIDLPYANSVSAVFSSKIEGNTMNLNSFMNSSTFASAAKEKEQKEILDLRSAYEFAQSNPLNEANLLAVHRRLSKLILIESKQGVYRDDSVGVFDSKGLVYLAVEADFLEREMTSFFEELLAAMSESKSVASGIYLAAFAHLRLAHIHPFADGNGRLVRILEKWVLSELLGDFVWKIPTEKFYFEHLSEYYNALNLGVNFYELDYSVSESFLSLLPTLLLKG